MGHGAPGVCALGATGLLPPGVVFAICPGDGEATPVRCPGGGDAPGEAALAGEVPGDAAGAVASTVAGELAAAGVLGGELPGDPAGAVPGELAGEDGGLETAAPWDAGEGETGCAAAGEAAAPCPAGLAAATGVGDSSGAGARAPMFARSWPIRIFPRNTVRSKM